MSSTVQIGQVDLQTGEILDGAVLAVVYPKRRNGFVEGWISMAQPPMLVLAQANLGGEAMRVFLVILAKLDYENYVVFNQSEIARLLGTRQPSISRAIARLVEEGVLLVGPKFSNRSSYSLNPEYGWKGSARNHHNALKQRMKARGLTIVDGGPGSLVEALEVCRAAEAREEASKPA